MRFVKTAVITLLCVLILTANAFHAFADDTPSPWAEAQVRSATEAGLVPERMQTNYIKAMTRAEFCTLAVKLYENVMGLEIEERKSFLDTEDAAIEKAAAVGLVSGTGDGLFSPDMLLTREQAAVMLTRLGDIIGLPFPDKQAHFEDEADISPWALESVGRVQAAGVMSGTGSFTFSPKVNYSLEQGIVTLHRLYTMVVSYKNGARFVSAGTLTEIAEQDTPLGAFPDREETDPLRQYALKVMELVNLERTKIGLKPLVEVEVLNQAAAVRASEISRSFSHERPDGRLGLTVFKDLDIANVIRAENIAGNYRSPESVVEAWMNSPSHRAIIVDARYTGQGVSVYKDSAGELSWAHLFKG